MTNPGEMCECGHPKGLHSFLDGRCSFEGCLCGDWKSKYPAHAVECLCHPPGWNNQAHPIDPSCPKHGQPEPPVGGGEKKLYLFCAICETEHEGITQEGSPKDGFIQYRCNQTGKHFIGNDFGSLEESPYCTKCGACGEPGCCHPSMCKGGEGCMYPEIYQPYATLSSRYQALLSRAEGLAEALKFYRMHHNNEYVDKCICYQCVSADAALAEYEKGKEEK